MFLFSCFTFFRWPASCERFSAVLNGIAVLLHKFHYYCLCCWCASARARMCEWVSIRGIRVSRKVSERSFTGVWLAECVSVGDWIVFVKFPIHSKSTLFVRFDFFFSLFAFIFFIAWGSRVCWCCCRRCYSMMMNWWISKWNYIRI